MMEINNHVKVRKKLFSSISFPLDVSHLKMRTLYCGLNFLLLEKMLEIFWLLEKKSPKSRLVGGVLALNQSWKFEADHSDLMENNGPEVGVELLAAFSAQPVYRQFILQKKTEAHERDPFQNEINIALAIRNILMMKKAFGGCLESKVNCFEQNVRRTRPTLNRFRIF